MLLKSADCIEHNHGSCQGSFKETVDSLPVTRICACPCHDSMYQLVRNTIALVNQAEKSDPFRQAGYDDRP